MNIKINLKSAQDIIKERGLDAGGKVQMAFADALLAYGDKRTPKQEGDLINSAEIQDGGKQIYYPSPYARYLWYGVAMEGKPPMHPTNRPLKFQGKLRGKEWLKRTWKDDGNKILQEIAEKAGGKVK